MEIDDGAAAGALVQAIDVLRDELEERAGSFPCRKRSMRGIRRRGRQTRPTRVGARPVTPVDRLLRAERLDHDRRSPLPLALVVAVIGNARGGAAAGPAESEDATVIGDPVAQPIVDRAERSHRGHRIAAES